MTITIIVLALGLIALIGSALVLFRLRNTSNTVNCFLLAALAGIAATSAHLGAATTGNIGVFRVLAVTANTFDSILIMLLLIFALIFTNRDEVLRRLHGMLLVFGPPLLLLILFQTTLVYNYGAATVIDISPQLVEGPLGILATLYHFGGGLVALIILVLYYRRVEDPRKKRETRVIIGANAVPIVIVLTYVAYRHIVPIAQVRAILGVLPTPYLPVIDLSAAVISVITVYALIKYGSAAFNPTDAASNVIETLPGALVILDRFGAIQFINQASSHIFGVRSNQLVGATIQSLFTSQKRYEEFEGKVFDPLRAGVAQVELPDLALQDSEGREVDVSLNATVRKDANGEVLNTVLIFTSIAQLKQAQVQLAREKANVERKVTERTHELGEAKARLAASIENLAAGLIMIDSNNQVVVKNKAASAILNFESNDWTVADFARGVTSSINLEDTYTAVRVTGKPASLAEVSYGTKILRLLVNPVFSEAATVGVVILFEDVTEAKVLERSRDEFFSIASHELRTPLTAIRGNAGMLLDLYKEILTREGMQEMVEDIHQSSMRLIDIVNDFLDVSRIEQGKVAFSYEKVALDKLIETVIYEMRAVLQEKHLYLKFNKKTLGELPEVWGDKNRLKQIIYNLVGNAAKFTDEGGITISASHKGKFVKILVTDTGRGISLDNQKLLFHKFQQAGESLLTRDTTRGTGLGLYISKMLAENMGGRMNLEASAENEGSSFSVTVPIEASKDKQPALDAQTTAKTDSKTGLTHIETISLAANALAKPASTNIVGQAGRLLIIEDDPYVLRMYARIFDGAALDIQTALNGSLGYKAAQSFKPDLILLDIMMPVMNGIETLDALKSDPVTKDIPVIMLSSLGEEGIVHQALSQGAVAFLIKSDFAPEQLVAEVQKRMKAVTEPDATRKNSRQKP